MISQSIRHRLVVLLLAVLAAGPAALLTACGESGQNDANNTTNNGDLAPPPLPGSTGDRNTQTPPATAGAAPVSIEPSLVDLGSIDPNSRHPLTARLSNNGAEPLTIASALPTCRCTTPEDLTGRVIAPGESITMEATYVASSAPGEKDASVVIRFNGYDQPVLFRMNANVEMAIRTTPQYVDGLQGATTGTLRVQAENGQPFRIISSNDEEPVYVGYDPDDEPRSNYILRWDIGDMPCEGMPIWWVIETDRADAPIIPVRIRHQCTGSRADPNRRQRGWMFDEYIVNAERIRAGETIELELGLYNPGGARVTSMTSLDPNMSIEMISAEERGEDDTLLRFRFTPSANYRGLLYAMMRVDSSTGSSDVAVVAQVHE